MTEATMPRHPTTIRLEVERAFADHRLIEYSIWEIEALERKLTEEQQEHKATLSLARESREEIERLNGVISEGRSIKDKLAWCYEDATKQLKARERELSEANESRAALRAYAELLRRELEDCCTRMDRCKGILRADRQAPEGWNVLDTKHARAALAKNPAAANAPVVNVTEGRPAPLPEASAGPECVHETNPFDHIRERLKARRDEQDPGSNYSAGMRYAFDMALQIVCNAEAMELRHQSCTKSPCPDCDNGTITETVAECCGNHHPVNGCCGMPIPAPSPAPCPRCHGTGELPPPDECVHQVNRWIPVSVRLPVPEVVDGETADFVPILFYAGGMVCAGRFFPDFSARKRIYKWRSLQGMEFKDADVTHWMPLPAAPDSEFVACTKQEAP